MSAQNSARQYAFVAESTFGVTPGSPETQLFEVVDFGLNPSSNQLSDPSIRSDRQIVFSRRGNTAVEGDISVAMCHGNYDLFLQAFQGGTWTANVLRNGNTFRSFAIEEGFTDLNQFQVFNGVVFNTFSMEVTPDALVQATFGCLGSTSTALTGTSIDSTPTAIAPEDKFFHEGGVINEGGSPVAFITAINFEGSNNFTGNYVLGSSSYRSMSLGRFSFTGTVTALFESAALYNKYRNSTNSSLSFQLAAGAKTHTYTFPSIRYTSGQIQRSESGPVLVELGFEAVRDAATQTTLQITRSA